MILGIPGAYIKLLQAQHLHLETLPKDDPHIERCLRLVKERLQAVENSPTVMESIEEAKRLFQESMKSAEGDRKEFLVRAFSRIQTFMLEAPE